MWVQEVLLRVIYPLGLCPEGDVLLEHDPEERDIGAHPLGSDPEEVLRPRV